MPYYRITIVLANKELFQGIRFYDNYSIEAVTNIVWVKASHSYGEQNVIDVEAAMLSNSCTAVKDFEAKQKAFFSGYK